MAQQERREYPCSLGRARPISVQTSIRAVNGCQLARLVSRGGQPASAGGMAHPQPRRCPCRRGKDAVLPSAPAHSFGRRFTTGFSGTR